MLGRNQGRMLRVASIIAMAMLSARASRAEVIQVEIVVRTTPSAADTTNTLPDKDSTACIGAIIYAEVWVMNVGPGATGVTGGTVDITFSPSLAVASVVDHGSVFTQLTTGAILPLLGVVNDLGGVTLDSGVAAAPEWAILATVEFQATSIGEAVFSLQPGAFRFAVSGGGPPLEFGTDVILGVNGAITIGVSDLPGDTDCNATVDLADFSTLAPCLSGPDAPVDTCDPALVDLNADGDSDLEDFAEFQINFTGGG